MKKLILYKSFVQRTILKPIKLVELYGVFTSLRQKLDESSRQLPPKKNEDLLESTNGRAISHNLLIGSVYTKDQLESGLKALEKPFLMKVFEY